MSSASTSSASAGSAKSDKRQFNSAKLATLQTPNGERPFSWLATSPPPLRVGDNCVYLHAPEFMPDGKTRCTEIKHCVRRLFADGDANTNSVFQGECGTRAVPLKELGRDNNLQDGKDMKGSTLKPLDPVMVELSPCFEIEGRLGGVFAGEFWKVFRKTKFGLICEVINPKKHRIIPIEKLTFDDPREDILKLYLSSP